MSANLGEYEHARTALRRLLIARGYNARQWKRAAALIAAALDIVNPDKAYEQNLAQDLALDFHHLAE